ncbi:FtsK/SpoIIIE domain-containing protein [Aneurinibacillus aneurinilyticus]|uniref:FtsK/SpoIIIE domain-containing protein n=1 Tax=Aneurinibacillus aneurinilyticus TaxID=1391 RepID=UPI003526B5CC
MKEGQVAIGRSGGEEVIHDFSTHPHLLVSGISYVGKSSVLRVLSHQLAFQETNLFWIVDMRDGVEYMDFASVGIKVLSSLEQVGNLLRDMEAEHEARIQLFQKEQIQNFRRYNEKQTSQKLKRCYVIVDELALVLNDKALTEEDVKVAQIIKEKMIRIAKQGRVTGIHLILSTQYAHPDIVPYPIRDNVTSRLVGYFSDVSKYKFLLSQIPDIKLDYPDMNNIELNRDFIYMFFDPGMCFEKIHSLRLNEFDFKCIPSISYEKGMILQTVL